LKQSHDNFLKSEFNKFVILLEQTNHNVELLADGLAMLDQRQDRMEKTMGIMQDDIAYMKNAHVHQEEFQPIVNRVEKIEKVIFK